MQTSEVMYTLFCKIISKTKFKLISSIKSINDFIRYFKTCQAYKLPIGKNRKYYIQGELHIDGYLQIDEFASIVVEKGGKLIVGNHVNIEPFCRIHVGKDNLMVIGESTSLNSFNILIGDIKIGRKCLIAPYVYLSSGMHQFKGRTSIKEADKNYLTKNKGKDFSSPIIVGDDCWLGISSVVMYGSHVGRGCIIGANSVVTANKRLEEYEIWGGVPAKYISKRE
ncbi:MAG: acyltransferase [Acaryochloris sp. RU_4_1]|nr:acyltransferase [Acaryochloris sp. RU_4_1]NJR53986.1 acyltransferase [Acaryochloris sp. CRU_2_0]